MSFTDTTNMAQRVAAALRLAKRVLTDAAAPIAIPSISGAITEVGVDRGVQIRATCFYFANVPGKEEAAAMFTLSDALEVQGFVAQRIVKILIIDYLLDLIEQGATV